MKSILVVVMGMLVAEVQAFAGLQLGVPSYGGTGCPQGSVSATLSPDSKQLSVLFDSYSVEASRTRPTDRKSCNVAIPVNVPHGISFSIIEVDYRGYNSLPRGASSQLDVEYFFAGTQGVRTSHGFTGEMDDNYFVQDRLGAAAVVWSPCGMPVNLRVNSSMRVKTNTRGEQAMATVDSMDVSSGIVYLIQWRTCR